MVDTFLSSTLEIYMMQSHICSFTTGFWFQFYCLQFFSFHSTSWLLGAKFWRNVYVWNFKIPTKKLTKEVVKLYRKWSMVISKYVSHLMVLMISQQHSHWTGTQKRGAGWSWSKVIPAQAICQASNVCFIYLNSHWPPQAWRKCTRKFQMGSAKTVQLSVTWTSFSH